MRLEIGAVVWPDFYFVLIKISQSADLPSFSDSSSIVGLMEMLLSHIDTNRCVFLAHHCRSTTWTELQHISV